MAKAADRNTLTYDISVVYCQSTFDKAVDTSKRCSATPTMTTLGSDPVNCFREAMPHEILADQAAKVMVSTNR